MLLTMSAQVRRKSAFQAFFLRRIAAAAPIKPAPKIASVIGSGAGVGAVFSEAVTKCGTSISSSFVKVTLIGPASLVRPKKTVSSAAGMVSEPVRLPNV